MRKKIVAGNWKMNLGHSEAITLVDEVLAGERASDVLTIFAVPSLYITELVGRVGGTPQTWVSAQNIHHLPSGAYTGEISASMLNSVGCNYTLIGHSERREYFHETDDQLTAKLRLAIDQGITPIFCCGESLDIRKSGDHVAYVVNQLINTVFKFKDEFGKFVIAYEPIWAIGTGETASPEQAQEMHHAIREAVKLHIGEQAAVNVSILYGGSVNAGNAASLFAQPDVDGGLVGGASLKSADFLTIINAFG